MAMIKASQAGPFIQDAVVLDLGDLRRQGEKIKAKAVSEAAGIIQEAQKEAKRLTDGAEERGYKVGMDKGRTDGLKIGQTEGHAEALQQSSEQLQKLQDAWNEALFAWDERKRQMLLEARQSLLSLVIELTGKVVRRVPKVDPTVVTDQLLEALQYITTPSDVSIRFNPADRPLVEEAMPALVKKLDTVEHATLLDDEEIQRGGCIVSYGKGQIDATLGRRLDRLVETLMPGGSERQVRADDNEHQESGDEPENEKI